MDKEAQLLTVVAQEKMWSHRDRLTVQHDKHHFYLCCGATKWRIYAPRKGLKTLGELCRMLDGGSLIRSLIYFNC